MEPFFQWLRFTATSTSLICILVLAHPRLNDPTYRYLLVISLCDLVYSLSLFLISCEFWLRRESVPRLPSKSHNYLSLLLYVAVSEYLTSSLALFNILTEAALTISRRNIIGNRYI
jgi:hypothetical protein